MATSRKKTVKKPGATAAKKAPLARNKKSSAAKKVKTAARPRLGTSAASSTAGSKSDAGYSKAAWQRMAKGSTAAKNVTEAPLMKALRAEHRHIATVMQVLSDQLKSIESNKPVDAHVIYEVMDYMVTWPDRYHHPREDLIYGRVAEIDAKLADEVDTLQRDHDQTAISGRKVLRDIQRWRDGDVASTVVLNSGRAYVDDMYRHMNVEEKVVFPHIESILSDEDWRELSEDDQMQAAPDPVFGRRVQREFRNLARRLRRDVRRGVERGTMLEWVGLEAVMESLEVMSMAMDAARDTAGDHLRTAWEESRDLFNEAPLSAPFRCAANNTRLAMALLDEVVEIARDTREDLSRVNRDRKERVRMLDA